MLFTAETKANRAFLKDTNKITFTDEDMEVRHPNHRRPLYLMASINQIPIKRVLVDIGVPHEGNKTQKKRQVHSRIHKTLAKSNTYDLSNPLSRSRVGGFLPHTSRTAMATQALTHTFNLSLVCEGKA